jgi:hypothetical protein
MAVMAAAVLVVLCGWVPMTALQFRDKSVSMVGQVDAPLAVAWEMVVEAPMARSFSG